MGFDVLPVEVEHRHVRFATVIPTTADYSDAELSPVGYSPIVRVAGDKEASQERLEIYVLQLSWVNRVIRVVTPWLVARVVNQALASFGVRKAFLSLFLADLGL